MSSGSEPSSPQGNYDPVEYFSENYLEHIGWAQYLKGLLERVPKGNEKHDTIDVDLDIATCKDLQDSIALIQQKLEKRREKQELNKETLRKQMQHVKQELGSEIALSMQHLDLYKKFMGRVVVTEELKDEHEAITCEIDRQLAKHPNRKDRRSGDTEGTHETGAGAFVPIKRRRQTAVMLMCNFFTGPLIVYSILLMIWYMLGHIFTFVAIIYYFWVVYDNKTRPFHGTGSRQSEAYRGSSIYRHLREYFPLRLVKANGVKHNPDGNYLFCLHPHGVQCVSVFNFLAVHSGFSKLFPGLSCTAQTLSMNFWLPVMREHCIALGAGNASVQSIKRALTWKKGASTVLVVGGAKEALYAAPHANKIALENRYGFIKVAIRSGAELVPCYSFGENSLYDNLADERPGLIKWQRRLQRLFTFAPLFVAGRGVFSYSGGLIPYRRAITTVVGQPIHLTQEDNPSIETVKRVHMQYVNALTDVFELYRDIYDPKCVDIELV
eukprot:TRINITY_DN2046_c0_g1_i1.p1 TRINITY_DN2046_c0_g1~~TRINITY_DN2046_c0_g1_i1.p1  ORF type:complete len:495 (+),score=60.72 TRINITY_DN2046_c0_g1_i1:38-1522(+)